jgi:hypothetical protein
MKVLVMTNGVNIAKIIVIASHYNGLITLRYEAICF